jgi:hypothetical protein
MEASNGAEFDMMMTKIIDEALNNTTERIADKIEEIIIKNTFSDPTPNKYYYNGTGQRTGDFENAWNKRNISNNIRKSVKEVFYDWESMRFEASNSQNYFGAHSDLYGNDIRKQLAGWLNQDDIVGGKVRHEFWPEVEEWTSKNLHKIFREELRKFGVM